MDPRPRKHVTTFLYLRLPIFISEIILTVVSTIQAFESTNVDSTCHFSSIIKFTVCLEWILIVFVLLGVIIVFNPVNDDNIEDGSILARRAWSRRFKIVSLIFFLTFIVLFDILMMHPNFGLMILLFQFKIRQDALMRSAIDDLANLVASFFTEGDLVLSDVAAGLLLVVHSPTNVYPPIVATSSDRPDWMTIKNALHFLHFSSCVYGWPTYLLHNFGVSPVLRLFRKLQCCGGLRCDRVLIVEDNCCFCNTAAFTLSTEKNNVDLFFVSFRNRLYEVPFVVLADHETKSIVITIRGSCSLMDLVTDLCLDDEVLSVDVDADPVLREDPSLDSGGEVRVHRGILMSARYVFDTLRKHQVLEDLFVLNLNYELVVCGHSLGAGVASLLTLLLKFVHAKVPYMSMKMLFLCNIFRQEYPSVRCFAFAPPGCVISENGLVEMEQHVMSIIGGDDVVSRISYHVMDMFEMNSCSAGDLIFFTKKSDSGFSKAVSDVARSEYYHVGIICSKFRIVHAIPSGIVSQPLCEVIKSVEPDNFEVVIVDTTQSEKDEAVTLAEGVVGCAYNDIFDPKCVNSQGERSFYCSQLVTEAYSGIEFPHHKLNFKNEEGEFIKYWVAYFDERKREIPQGLDGSHPATLRQACVLKMRLSRQIGKQFTIPVSIKEALHFVNGSAVHLPTGKSFSVTEPRSGSILAECFPASSRLVSYAVLAAHKAQPEWAKYTWMDRGEILRKAAETCTWKVAPALACGNAVVYKPSPLAPISAVILARLLKAAGLPDGIFNVIQGEAETGMALIDHPLVKKVSFTGSISTGKKIMQACATRNIKPVTLELGGKSSLIICEDADLESAVAGAMIANFYSQGQVCSNASKVLVHQSIIGQFTDLLKRKTLEMVVDDPLKESTRVGAHITQQHMEKVLAYIAGAVSEGAKIVCGGNRIVVSGLEEGYYLSPCILTDVKDHMTVYKEEIFGSVMLVIPFTTEEEAVEMANDTSMGLAGGVFTNNKNFILAPLVPFGGFDQSGFGRENGTAVIEHYTQIKSVFVNTNSKLPNPF
uniref:Lipase_3 domain-containing protein n=1 Tax=Heterorhabditis bacteriophora TaxID=37862 RepID=A0A1I7XKL8_HETBA